VASGVFFGLALYRDSAIYSRKITKADQVWMYNDQIAFDISQRATEQLYINGTINEHGWLCTDRTL
jgi:hypothetical protein